MSTNESNRLGTMVHTIVNELVNHYGKKLDRAVIDEITRNLTLEMCQGPTAWAFSGKELPDCAKVVAIDEGKPGSDMTAKATFRNEGGKLTLESIEHCEPVSLCAASVGGVRCQSVRTTGLFCASHQSAKSRMYLPTITNESLAFMMQRDGEQQ